MLFLGRKLVFQILFGSSYVPVTKDDTYRKQNFMKLSCHADTWAGRKVPYLTVLGCLPRRFLQLPFLMMVETRTRERPWPTAAPARPKLEWVGTGRFPISQP